MASDFELPGSCLRRGFRQHQLEDDYGCAHNSYARKVCRSCNFKQYNTLALGAAGDRVVVLGARRRLHLRYAAGDALFARLCGLARIRGNCTVMKGLKQFTQASLRALARVNRKLLDG